jgi:hypothetical protein
MMAMLRIFIVQKKFSDKKSIMQRLSVKSGQNYMKITEIPNYRLKNACAGMI